MPVPGPEITIVLVDADASRAAMLRAALTGSGYRIVAVVGPGDDLVAAMRQHRPGLVIVDIESPDRDTLDSMRALAEDRMQPIVMFVDETDEAATVEAIRAGVSAYIVDGLSANRVKPILDVAIARFREHERLKRELDDARESLEERKIVERAKGILMESRNLGEDAAYKTLRKLAMDRKQRLADVARELIEFALVLKR
ncbi:MAG: ANTAR domain-containing protein [Rhodospirillales bacterium]|nr:ANTAR domain-containing protein [Rhodospirillales bacterium]